MILSYFLLFSLLICFTYSNLLDQINNVQESNVEFITHLGLMKIKVLGPNDGIPIIAIHGMNIALVDEWYNISKYLSTNGYKICMVNFHSNPNLKPQNLNPIDFSIILTDITNRYFKVNKLIVMGKSWGAQNAAIYSSSNSKFITKLVLIAPGIPRGNKQIPVLLSKNQNPIFLAWAEDDPIMSESTINIWKNAFQNNQILTTYTVASGGHVIFDEYAKPIQTFLESN